MKLTLQIAICALLPGLAQAQWTGNATEGTPVCITNNTTAKTSIVTYRDPLGNQYLAWEDERDAANNSVDIYFQKLNADGTIAYAAAGVPACIQTARQRNHSMTTDGAGGVVIVWEDERAGSGNTDIYAQRINAAGTPLWGAEGTKLITAAGNQTIPRVVPFDADNFLMIWRDDRNDGVTGQDIYFSIRANATGAAVGSSERILTEAAGDQSNFQVAKNGSATFIVWEDYRLGTSNRDIYGSQINAAGDIVAGWDAGGKAICTATGNQLAPQLAPDGGSGAYFVWGDQRISANDSNIFLAHLLANGSLATGAWPADGLQITDAALNQTNPRICADGIGNAIVSWGDGRQGLTNRDIYAQKVLGNGTISYVANGISIVTAIRNQPGSVTQGFNMVSNGTGGAIVVWEDARISTSDYQIYAQNFTGTGIKLWPDVATEEGAAVNIGVGNQRSPSIFEVVNEKVTIVWEDSRTSSNGEILANQLNFDGTLPVSWLMLSGSWEKQLPQLQWQIATTDRLSRFIVERSTDGGINFVEAGQLFATTTSAQSSYQFTDNYLGNNPLWYRVKAMYANGNAEKSPIVFLQKNSNAVANKAEARFDQQRNALYLKLPPATVYEMQLVAINGKVMQKSRLPLGTGSWMIMDTHTLTPGSYVVALTGADGQRTTFQFIKFN